MRWLLALLLIMIGAVDLGVFIAGPRAENHQVALSYHPAWLPSVLAPLIPGLPDTAPIPLPRGSYSGLGAIPAPFMPLVKHLWVGGHTYMWPMSVQSAAAWARRHVGSVWKPVLHGERVDPGQPTTYEWGFNSRQVPYQTLYMDFRAVSPSRTMVTLAVQSIELPKRPASTYLPLNAESVRIVYHTYHPRTQSVVIVAHRTVSALLDIINRGGLYPMGVGNCAAYTWDADLIFRYPHGQSIAVQYAAACDWVVIGRASGSPIKVDALYALITRIARSAGLKPMPGN